METFDFKLHAPAANRARPNTRTFQLGDGVKTRLPVGIVQNFKVYRLEWRNLFPTDADPIIAFFERHEGHLTFKWVDPRDNKPGLYQCVDWSHRVLQALVDIGASFEEVSF